MPMRGRLMEVKLKLPLPQVTSFVLSNTLPMTRVRQPMYATSLL